MLRWLWLLMYGCVAWPTYKPTPKALFLKFSQKLSAYTRVYTVARFYSFYKNKLSALEMWMLTNPMCQLVYDWLWCMQQASCLACGCVIASPPPTTTVSKIWTFCHSRSMSLRDKGVRVKYKKGCNCLPQLNFKKISVTVHWDNSAHCIKVSSRSHLFVWKSIKHNNECENGMRRKK